MVAWVRLRAIAATATIHRVQPCVVADTYFVTRSCVRGSIRATVSTSIDSLVRCTNAILLIVIVIIGIHIIEPTAVSAPIARVSQVDSQQSSCILLLEDALLPLMLGAMV